jgi:iron complex transport system ATP-binding protein
MKSEKMEPIVLRDVRIGYRTKEGVGCVAGPMNASLRSGQLTVLLGPNGAGKSTLLRTLAGFQPALGGEIRILERTLTEYTPLELAKVVSVVLTEKPDIQNMTVRELVGMGRSPHTGFWGRLSLEDKRLVETAMEQMGVQHLAGRPGQSLSDGERQKCMIAKALAQATPIILLDEPSAFLDYPSKVEVMQKLHELAHTHHKSIFLSTHDMELALQTADYVWLMDKNNSPAYGTPEDIILTGQLGKFFNRDGIRFDPLSGQFTILNVCDRTALLTGDEVACALVTRALYRNGIRCVEAQSPSSAPADFTLHCEESLITVRDKDGRTTPCTTIEQVVETCKS